MTGARTAVVTGATAGLGAAFAETLAGRGYDLVLVARTVDRLDQASADLRHRFGGSVQVMPADLSDPEQVSRVEHRLSDASQPVTLLVNCAGFSLNRRFLAGDVDDEERQLDVLVRSVLRLTHAAVPGMVARGDGAVLNVSSVAGWLPGGTYSAAKAWVTVFSEGLAAELAGTGVQVMALCPGFVHTEFHARGQMDVSAIPDWMWLTPQQVVDAALADMGRGRRVSVPSARFKVLAAVARHGPRRAVGAAYRRGRPKR